MKKLVSVFAVALIALGISACDQDSDVTLKSETDAQIGKNTKVVATNEPMKSVSVEHTIDYQGTKIPVVATYMINKNLANNWHFTYQSNINLQIKTGSIPSNARVLVNNIYSDVSIVSNKVSTNGIRQDSLEQSYSQLPSGGIDVNSENSYSIPFQVEGINENETSMTILNGYGWTEKYRITEGDLKEHGAQGAKLNVVWTLLVNEDGRTFSRTVSDHIGLPSK